MPVSPLLHSHGLAIADRPELGKLGPHSHSAGLPPAGLMGQDENLVIEVEFNELLGLEPGTRTTHLSNR